MTAVAERPTRHALPRSTAAAVRDRRVRTAAEALLVVALTLVTFWWATGGGLSDLGGWASGLTSLGRLTGLLASVLLLVQVLLMARVPLLEQAFGQDRLAVVHRLVGFTSFTAMIAHIGLITWGYAAGDLLATPGELWDLTLTYPGMLLAAAGTACLVMVVVTSVRAARARLRYESWHLLHLYAYLGVGLALPHQLWTGQEFLASTASAPRPGSSSSGASSPAAGGPARTPTRSRPPPTGAACASPSRTSATGPRRCRVWARAPAS